MKRSVLKKGIALLLCLCMMVPALCGCGKKAAGSATSGFTAGKVTITYVKSPLNVPSIVEKAQSSFETAYKAKGVDMAYSEITSGADQTAALASGDIQILNNVGGASVIISAAGGADIKILSMYTRAPKAFMLYAKDNSIHSPADLKGKTIAGPKGTTLNELLAAYLKSGGLTLSDVNFVSMDIPSARAALEGGSVDCALLAGPNAYNAGKEGLYMVTNGEGLITGSSVVATTQKFYDENRELVDTFLQVQKDTLEYIKNNYEDSMQMTAKETDLEMEAVEEMYPLYDFSMDVTDSDVQSLKDTQDFLLEAGMIENTVDVGSLFLNNK